MIVVDTHVAFWLLCEPDRLSERARLAISDSDEIAVAGISWYELARLIDAGRIEVTPSAEGWLSDAASSLTTIGADWQIAHRAADLSRHPAFPKDPADRLIYATALHRRASLVTRDDALLSFDARTCVW